MPAPFDLLETLKWTPGEGFYLLERHLQRLIASARHFGIGCSIDLLRKAMAVAVEDAHGPLRARLLVDQHGIPRVELVPLEPAPTVVRVGLAASPIDPTDPFFFHKTTHRVMLEEKRLPAYDDTLLWNPAREITESTIANVVVDRDGRKVTPPVACGLLPGTLRAELLARGEIVEDRVTVEQLRNAPRFWLINSVRGWTVGKLVSW
jgi:para-aminobenzoate synthetase/4-amino-4-deoxychorismate lyase